MGKNKKMSVRQIIFASAFVATVLIIADDLFDWKYRIYLGIFAGLTTLTGIGLAKILFKDKS
ncbi:hypothetical protein AABM38_12320 [Heyndrickxia sp. MSNUG]|uniref:hypothetical protein n=1 Tax=Heyndrickxia sp. MSNUG TaxID=3136677 RepID=UPI003C2BA6EF